MKTVPELRKFYLASFTKKAIVIIRQAHVQKKHDAIELATSPDEINNTTKLFLPSFNSLILTYFVFDSFSKVSYFH